MKSYAELERNRKNAALSELIGERNRMSELRNDPENRSVIFFTTAAATPRRRDVRMASEFSGTRRAGCGSYYTGLAKTKYLSSIVSGGQQV